MIPTYEGESKTFYITGNEIKSLINSWNLENYGFKIIPLEEELQKYFYSKEGAQEAGNINYAPALILEYE